jgi:hypothetical protein
MAGNCDMPSGPECLPKPPLCLQTKSRLGPAIDELEESIFIGIRDGD